MLQQDSVLCLHTRWWPVPAILSLTAPGTHAGLQPAPQPPRPWHPPMRPGSPAAGAHGLLAAPAHTCCVMLNVRQEPAMLHSVDASLAETQRMARRVHNALPQQLSKSAAGLSTAAVGAAAGEQKQAAGSTRARTKPGTIAVRNSIMCGTCAAHTPPSGWPRSAAPWRPGARPAAGPA